MRLFPRPPGVLLTLSAMLVVSVTAAYGQNFPIDTGLQILQGLSPEQRDAISQQLGSGGLAGGEGAGGTHAAPATEQQQSLMLQQQREQLLEQRQLREEGQRLSPYLSGDDWIVVTIDSNPLPTPAQLQPGALTGPAAFQQNVLGAPAELARGAGVPSGAESGVAPLGMGSAAMAVASGSQGANVTAGGYTPLPLPESCAADSNCDPTRPTRPELNEDEKARLQALIDLIRSKNPYQLSHDGVLSLPGFAPIPLAGLTERLATLRLGVEPSLRDLFIRVTKLPLAKRGPTRLKPFGYDLFDQPVSTFAPAMNVPVPAQYVIGAGDQLDVQLYGAKNASVHLIVDRDGQVSFPELGPINVGGQTFASVKALLESRVERADDRRACERRHERHSHHPGVRARGMHAGRARTPSAVWARSRRRYTLPAACSRSDRCEPFS